MIPRNEINDKSETRSKILAAKEEKGMTFSDIADQVGGDKTFLASATYDAASMTKDDAMAFAEVLDLGRDVVEELQKPPMKGQGEPTIPSDPCLYRLYEVPQVYGPAIKALIHEEFGDGIMSAIDFEVSVDKEPYPEGDHVVITYDGKFLPYKRW